MSLHCRMISWITRRYPFYSGCARLANLPIIRKVSGVRNEWAPVSGGSLLCPMGDMVGRSVFYTGHVDKKISWVCRRMIEPGDTVLDIGANIGQITMLMSSLVGPKGLVMSFEPNPDVADSLKKSVSVSGADNVTVYQEALGDQEGVMSLSVPRGNAGAASLKSERERRVESKHDVRVRCLDDVVDEAGVKSISMIKMDVEGFESEVLSGAKRIFADMRPKSIVFESNDKCDSESSLRVLKILRNNGYDILDIPRCMVRMRLSPFGGSSEFVHDHVAIDRQLDRTVVGRCLNVRGWWDG